MNFLSRPFGDRVSRPLLAALVWASLVAAAVAAIAAVVGGIGWVAAAVRSIFADAPIAVPWSAVQGVAAVGAVFVVAASAWAAAYGATDRLTAGRALLGTVAGIAALALSIRLRPVLAGLAAFAPCWALALPFERWGRVAARLAASPIAAVAALLLVDADGWWLAVTGIAGALLAAATVLGGDAAWVMLGRTNPTPGDRRGGPPGGDSLP